MLVSPPVIQPDPDAERRAPLLFRSPVIGTATYLAVSTALFFALEAGHEFSLEWIIDEHHAGAWAALAASGGILHWLLNRMARTVRGRLSLSELPEPALLIRGNGTVVDWNKLADQLIGPLAPDSLTEYVVTDDLDALRSGLARAGAYGRSNFLARTHDADGRISQCRWTLNTLSSSSGDRALMIATLRDVTAERQALAESEEAERRYREMVEVAPHLIAVVADRRVRFINPAGARLLGEHDPLRIVGEPWERFCAESHDASGRLRRTDGNEVEVEVIKVPILVGGELGMLLEARDMTQVNLATTALREAELRLAGVLDSVSDAVLTVEAGGTVMAVNPAAEILFGSAQHMLVGQVLPDLIEDSADILSTQSLAPRDFGERLARHRDGQTIPVKVAATSQRLGEPHLLSIVLRDLSEAKQVQTRLAVAEKVMDSTSEGVMVTDKSGTILWVNNGFCKISGYAREEVIGENARLLKSGLQGPDFYKAMWKSIAATGMWAGEIWNRRKDGEAYPEWLTISAVTDASGQPRYVGVFSDISRHKRAEETIKQLTYYDAVTRLPNRYLFQDRLSQALERAGRDKKSVGVVVVSLDRFKTVNETLGHQVGDALLREVATRLGEAVRSEDTVSRMRGDTFCCALSDLATGDDATPMLNRIMEAFAPSYLVGGHELFVTASAGIAVYPVDGVATDDLLQKAETAMNRSKEKGENLVQFYAPDMNANSVERLRLETDLRKAIGRDELELYYQPKVEAASGRIIGAEALVRWHHTELGMVSPGKFIPIAEATGLIGAIGDWVLRAAAKQIFAWKDAGLPVVPVAVNLSAQQFHHPELVESVVRVLKECNVSPEMVELELTESAVMQNAEETVRLLNRLHDSGLTLSIDDFGTGYSSLSYLKRFPIDKLKVDRSFVQDLGVSEASGEIVEAIIAMAHSLNLAVVAEGVETDTQLDLLRELGCDQIQGYYFSKPVPADQFARLLRLGTLEKAAAE